MTGMRIAHLDISSKRVSSVAANKRNYLIIYAAVGFLNFLVWSVVGETALTEFSKTTGVDYHSIQLCTTQTENFFGVTC